MYKPQIDDIETIAHNIIQAGVVIQNIIPMYSELVEADVKVNKALADLEWLCDTKRCEVSSRPENTGKPSVYIKVLYLNETINERHLVTICKGYIVTLKSLLYRASK